MKKSRDVVVSLALIMVLISACAFRAQPTPSVELAVSVDLATARSKIKHIIIIMQENRSFDH
jgi:phospholipase C